MFFLLLPLLSAGLMTGFEANALSVEVKGNRSIETETVKLYADIGEDPSEKDLSKALGRIYKTGFFSDVRINYEGDNIEISVKETPIIKKIEFNGTKVIGKDKMLEELSTKEKKFFSKISILNDVKRLTAIYQKLGFLDAKVNPMVKLVDDGQQVVVIFDVKEGRRAKIAKISIEGNEHFSDTDIKDKGLKVRQMSIFKFNMGAGFDMETVQNEQENIKKFYEIRGFPKIKVKNVLSKFDAKKNVFYVTYFIEEGGRHRFGKSEIISFVEDFDEKKITDKMIKTHKGKKFNSEKIQDTIAQINEVLYEGGFMFAQVEHELVYQENNVVDVKYTLRNSRRVYLDSVEIVGNKKTSDNVIRREILVKEGDVYNIAKIRRSIQRIQNLQYFDDVQINEKAILGSDDRVAVTITVRERSTASINASVGFDQINGLAGNIGVQESNLFGEGYNGSVSFERTAVSESYGVSFTNPYFRSRDILLGGNMFYSKYGNPQYIPYNSETLTLGLTMAYSITEYLRHSINYRYQVDSISQNSETLSPFIIAQLGNNTTSALSHTLMYDKRDNNFIPNDGYSFMLKQEVAGFGGNIKFFSNEMRADWYQTLFVDGLVLGLKGRMARIQGIGGKGFVNVQNMYSLGGGFGMRGFNYRGLGPTLAYLDSDTGAITGYESFSYGGKNLQLASVELRFPNGLPKDIGLTTYLFTDVGTLYGIDSKFLYSDAKMIDEKYYRVSAGVGVSWRSPMGPIGFALGRAIRQTAYDKKLFFLITFGGTSQM